MRRIMFWSPCKQPALTAALIFALFALGKVQAQNLSFQAFGGANSTRPLGNGFYDGQRTLAGYGYSAEGGLSYQLSARLAAEASLLYQVNRYRVDNVPHPAISSSYEDQFLDLPLLLNYTVYRFGANALQLLGGLYGSYWLASRAEGTYANVFSSTWDPETGTEQISLDYRAEEVTLDGQYKRFSMGYSVGVGAKRALTKKLAVGLRLLLQQDLLDRLAADNYQRRYQRFAVQCGIFYTIKPSN